MKSGRSWNRREFSVTPAGFFTVLKPQGWFSAARLSQGFRYLIGPPKGSVPSTSTGVLEQKGPAQTDSNEAPAVLQIIAPSASERHLLRFILIVLIAALLTLAVLWWMIPVNPFRDQKYTNWM